MKCFKNKAQGIITSLELLILFYSKIFASFSTSVIPAIPKFSPKTFATLVGKKAGNVGPNLISLITFPYQI